MAFKYAAVRQLSCPSVVLTYESATQRETLTLRMNASGIAELKDSVLCDFDPATGHWLAQSEASSLTIPCAAEARILAMKMIDEIGRCGLLEMDNNSAIHQSFYSPCRAPNPQLRQSISSNADRPSQRAAM